MTEEFETGFYAVTDGEDFLPEQLEDQNLWANYAHKLERDMKDTLMGIQCDATEICETASRLIEDLENDRTDGDFLKRALDDLRFISTMGLSIFDATK